MVDRPFWKDRDPVTGEYLMSMTLTDRPNRATYLLDNGDDKPAVILLSYTWNDDTLKWLALSAERRMELMLHSLQKIYPGVDIRSHIVGQPITVSWEAEPNFMGAFKANLPGHYRYQERLYTHFDQHELAAEHRGIFLTGDDVSWTAGWAEGAVTTGLNAVWGVLKHLGGSLRCRESRARASCWTRWGRSAWTERPAGGPAIGGLPSRRAVRGAPREFLVVRGVALHAVELLVGELAPDLGRDAGHQRAGRDDRAFEDHGAGGHERAGADHRAVEDGGAHADEAVVLNGAAVHDGAVPHADARARRCRGSRGRRAAPRCPAGCCRRPR